MNGIMFRMKIQRMSTGQHIGMPTSPPHPDVLGSQNISVCEIDLNLCLYIRIMMIAEWVAAEFLWN